MKTYARIHMGRVDELFETGDDIATLFHPSLTWVPLKGDPRPELGWFYNGKKFLPPTFPKHPVTPKQVDAERDRRIDGGMMFKGVRYQTRASDRENIMEKVVQALTAKMMGGKWPRDFVWIAEDNRRVPMDLETVLAFGDAVSRFREAHVFAANELKRRAVIPINFKDDRWWSA